MVSFLSLCSESCQCDNFPDCNAVVSTVYYCATVMMSSTHAIPSKELMMNNRNGCHLVGYVVIVLFVFCFQRRSVVHWCPKEGYSIAFQMLVIG